MGDIINKGGLVVEEVASTDGYTTSVLILSNLGMSFETGTNTRVRLWNDYTKTEFQTTAISLKKVFSFKVGDEVYVRNEKLASQTGDKGVVVPSSETWLNSSRDPGPGKRRVTVSTRIGTYEFAEWELYPAKSAEAAETIEDAEVEEDKKLSEMKVYLDGYTTHSLTEVVTSKIDEDGDLTIKTNEDDGTLIHIVKGAWDTYVVTGLGIDV